jgi:CBS domain-containing protein
MALFLGTKGDILAWRGTSELVAGLKEMLADKMASLSAEDELQMLHGALEKLTGELAFEKDFTARFDETLYDLERATCQDLLPPLHVRFNSLAADYFKRRGSVLALHTLCNAYRDGLLRKALAIAEQGMSLELLSKPPAPHCLLAAGVAGRQEQTLSIAADYFFVYENGNPDTATYFRQFSYRVMAILDGSGLLSGRRRKKPGDTFWHGSLAEWRQWIDRGLHPENAQRPELGVLPSLTVTLKAPHRENDESHRVLARLADLRTICGDGALAGAVTGTVRDALADQCKSGSLAQLVKKVTGRPVALGFFGGFRTEKSGEQRRKVNLDLYAIAPLVMNVRMLAVKYGAKETGTVGRIKELLDQGHINVELADRLLKAYHEFIKQKILLETGQEGKGKTGWFLDPGNLSREDEQRLKDGLEAVISLQKIVHIKLTEA